jgi:hypothetical protein
MPSAYCIRCRHRLARLEAARASTFCETCREVLQIGKWCEAVVAVDEEPPPEPGPAPGRSFSTRADLEAAAGISPVSEAPACLCSRLAYCPHRSGIAQGSLGDPMRGA